MQPVDPKPAKSELKIVEDATCTDCGCVCDDIVLKVADGRITEAENACELGRSWFVSCTSHDAPACSLSGRAVSIEEGIEEAARILASARYPLVYGLSETSCEAQRVAVGIADWIGGTIDTSTSLDHGPTGSAFHNLGEVTCTLGEIRNRGDFILYWGCDPAESHPRHMTRYSLMPEGMFLPNGRQDRTCVVVDICRTKTAEQADLFLQIEPHKDFEALWTLRALAQGLELDAVNVEAQTGVPLADWQDLVDRMKRARYGVLLFGSGLTTTRGRHLNCDALLALTSDLNAETRFVCRAMRGRGNVTGADNVLLWRTGYPISVNFARGYPRFNPGEYTASEALARREADAALIVASDPLSQLSRAARERLSGIPYIAIDAKETATTRRATVAFRSATYGIHTGGTVYRMDDVSLPLRPALSSPLPGDVEILTGIESRVRQMKVRRSI